MSPCLYEFKIRFIKVYVNQNEVIFKTWNARKRIKCEESTAEPHELS